MGVPYDDLFEDEHDALEVLEPAHSGGAVHEDVEAQHADDDDEHRMRKLGKCAGTSDDSATSGYVVGDADGEVPYL